MRLKDLMTRFSQESTLTTARIHESAASYWLRTHSAKFLSGKLKFARLPSIHYISGDHRAQQVIVGRWHRRIHPYEILLWVIYLMRYTVSNVEAPN